MTAGATTRDPSRPYSYGELAVDFLDDDWSDPVIKEHKATFSKRINFLRRMWEKSNSTEQRELLMLAIRDLQSAESWAFKALMWDEYNG